MIVDVSFGISAPAALAIPADHGYALYGAVTSLIPALHRSSSDGPAFAIHPIHGSGLPGRALALTPASAVTLRVHHDQVKTFLPLAGKALRIGAATIRLGVPTARPLTPAPHLQARLVVIKGFTEPVAFLEAVRRQIAHAGTDATPHLLARTSTVRFEGRTIGADGPIRRTVRIREKEVVGFAVRVSGLTPEASLALQSAGIGGRQHFGCGVLAPVPPDLRGHLPPTWSPPPVGGPA